LLKIVAIKNEEHLIDALKAGKGVVVVSAHLGNFPLLFVSLVRKGYKVNVIIRKMRNENFSKFIYDLCAKWGVNMIQLEPRRNFIKESLKVLRKNELLFIMLDEVVPKDSGIVVDFFNRKVERAVGPMLFHDRVGSPILPIFIVQEEEGILNICIKESMKIEGGLSPDENNHKNISNLTQKIEQIVTQYPLQWGGWLNKRWN